MSRQSDPAGLVRDGGYFADRVVTDVVLTTSTAIQLTPERDGDRVFVINALVTGTCTITLPKATGSGTKYTIRNNVVLTQVVAIVGKSSADVFSGTADMIHTTAVATSAESFQTTATDYICRWRGTSGTTGGKRGDVFEAIDIGPSLWLVTVRSFTTGAVATPFASS
jgi:hypothetical protein